MQIRNREIIDLDQVKKNGRKCLKSDLRQISKFARFPLVSLKKKNYDNFRKKNDRSQNKMNLVTP